MDSFRQRVRGWNGHSSKEGSGTSVCYTESEFLLYICRSCAKYLYYWYGLWRCVNVWERYLFRISAPKMKVSESFRDLPGRLGHTKLMFHIYIRGCYALRAFYVVFNEENRQRQHCKSNSPKDNVTRPADTLRPCWIETSADQPPCTLDTVSNI